MRVIFLDFDGVLNSRQFMESGQFGTGEGLDFGHSQIDPAAVERLNKIVEATGAKIVISSSWRHIWSLGEIVKMLKKRGFRFTDSIIGVTPSLLSNRGSEVAEWLGRQEEHARIGGDSVQSYAILDDSTDFEPEQHEHMVHTDAHFGLTDDDIGRAISILGM